MAHAESSVKSTEASQQSAAETSQDGLWWGGGVVRGGGGQACYNMVGGVMGNSCRG